MSVFGEHGVRCDVCGRWSNREDGAYSERDGTTGYINGRGSNGSQDWCDQCYGGFQLKAGGRYSSKAIAYVLRCRARGDAVIEIARDLSMPESSVRGILKRDAARAALTPKGKA